jgi:hypothetical protein
MTAQITKTNHSHTAILSVFLLTVIASGAPQVEIHTHQNAHFGHEHGVSQHLNHHDNKTDSSNDVEGFPDSGTTHSHDLGVSAVTLVDAVNLDMVVHRHGNERISPPTTAPPDNVTAPLYRPPIA